MLIANRNLWRCLGKWRPIPWDGMNPLLVRNAITSRIEAHRQPGQKLKALAFCRDISHAIRMAQAMEDYYPNGTRYLTGKNSTGERVRAYKDFHSLTLVLAKWNMLKEA